MKTVELRRFDSAASQVPVTAIIAPARTALRPAEFAIEAPDAHEVYLAGTFNNWDTRRTPLKKHPHGLWQFTLRLSPGRHEYRFVVDGIWTNDPKATETVPNPFGTENSVLVIES